MECACFMGILVAMKKGVCFTPVLNIHELFFVFNLWGWEVLGSWGLKKGHLATDSKAVSSLTTR